MLVATNIRAFSRLAPPPCPQHAELPPPIHRRGRYSSAVTVTVTPLLLACDLRALETRAQYGRWKKAHRSYRSVSAAAMPSVSPPGVTPPPFPLLYLGALLRAACSKRRRAQVLRSTAVAETLSDLLLVILLSCSCYLWKGDTRYAAMPGVRPGSWPTRPGYCFSPSFSFRRAASCGVFTAPCKQVLRLFCFCITILRPRLQRLALLSCYLVAVILLS
jgi:hypothetical protein